MVHFNAGTFSDAKALGKPNMVWFISLQGTNNFTNIWLYWRTSTTVTLHIKHISFSFIISFITLVLWGWKEVVSRSSVKDIPDDLRTTIWISYWIGWEVSIIWNGSRNQTKTKSWAKALRNQSGWREESKGRDQSLGEILLILIWLWTPERAPLTHSTWCTWCWGVVVISLL